MGWVGLENVCIEVGMVERHCKGSGNGVGEQNETGRIVGALLS